MIKVITAKICEYIINKLRHQIDKKFLRQDRVFSTRLNYANKKITEIWINMVNTTFSSTEDMIIKLQNLKGKTKAIFFRNISNFYNNMNVRMNEDPFAKNALGIRKISHEVLLSIKVLQTKPQVRNMNINPSDLYFTVIKNRKE